MDSPLDHSADGLDSAIHPPDDSRSYHQYDLATPDFVLMRECAIELIKRGEVDLGEDLLLLIVRLRQDNFRVYLGLALAHKQRIIDMSDGVKYRARGATLLERVNGEWVPAPEFIECEQQCISNLDRAISLAPKEISNALMKFKDIFLESTASE